LGVAGHDPTVIACGPLDGHVPVADVAEARLGLGVRGVPPPAAAGGDVAEPRARPRFPERHPIWVAVGTVVHAGHVGLLAALVGDPDAAGRPVAAAVDAEAGRALVPQRHQMVLGRREPERVAQHRRPAAVVAGAGGVGHRLRAGGGAAPASWRRTTTAPSASTDSTATPIPFAWYESIWLSASPCRLPPY